MNIRKFIKKMDKELKLIAMIQQMQSEQEKYWYEKKKYGNSSTQLRVCKASFKAVKEYCIKRKKEIITPCLKD